MTKQAILALLLLFSILPALIAQSPVSSASPAQTQTQTPAQTSPTPDDKDDVVRITTNLVQVDAVVTKNGKPVRDLKAEDFEIFEDGHRQQITTFAYISNVPGAPPSTGPADADKNVVPTPSAPLRPNDPRRTIALVVDDLGLSFESMAQVRRQLRKFVSEQLAPNDLVAIIRTGGQMGALQQFTNDRRVIEKALSQVKWNMCSRVGISVFSPVRPSLIPNRASSSDSSDVGPCGQFSVGTTMRALRFIVEAMGELPGRKSMVVFSDSLPREEQEFKFNQLGGDQLADSLVNDTRNYSFLLQRIAEKAIRSSVVIYAVDAGGLQYTGLTAADSISGPQREMNAQISNILSSRSRLLIQRREGADLIAKQTGGFLIRNSNDFQMDRILEDQSGYYLLGYRPTEETFNKHFHHIKARVKQSGMTLRTRFGFFGISEEDANRAKRTPEDKTLVALMSPFGAQDIEIELTTFFANDKTAGSIVRSFLYLNAKDLSFTESADGWHNSSIEVRGIIFGNNGSVVNQVTHPRTLRLRGNSYEQALREGINLQFDMPVKQPGSYQIRVATRDVSSSRIGAAGQFVAVPDLNNHRLALSGIVMRGVAADPLPSTSQQRDVNPAFRRFPAGTKAQFACVIYNATIDTTSHLPNLVMQARLFRDATNIYSSPQMVIDVSRQTDLSRVVANGVVGLDSALEPGNYYLQLVITDTLAMQKQEPVVQWIDFEIVK